MKRFLLSLIFVITMTSAFAKPPRLAVQELFDGRYKQNKNVTTSIIKRNDDYHMSMTIMTNDTKIVKEVMNALQRDAKKATDKVEIITDGNTFNKIEVPSNDEIITIGVSQDQESGMTTLFIRGERKAFE